MEDKKETGQMNSCWGRWEYALHLEPLLRIGMVTQTRTSAQKAWPLKDGRDNWRGLAIPLAGVQFSVSKEWEGGPRRRQGHREIHTVICACKGYPGRNSKTRLTEGKTGTKGMLWVRVGRPETDRR